MINEGVGLGRARVTERGLEPCIIDVCSSLVKGKSPNAERWKQVHEVDNMSVPKCDEG